jgi:hypothetical protein
MIKPEPDKPVMKRVYLTPVNKCIRPLYFQERQASTICAVSW